MKTILIILTFFFIAIRLFGQDYIEVTFNGVGAEPEFVSVYNLTQGTNLEMDGSAVLHLILKSTTLGSEEVEKQRLMIFPNPAKQYCSMLFFNEKYGNVSILIYDISGKLIHQYNNMLPEGKHAYSITGLCKGSYIVNILTETDILTGKLYSIGKSQASYFSISKIEIFPIHKIESPNSIGNRLEQKSFYKDSKIIVEMDYDIGDELKFIGKVVGFENDTLFDSPLYDETYTFVFTELLYGQPCPDMPVLIDQRDDKTYSTVQIGNQCWMAENLAFLPTVTAQTTSSDTIPCYYVYDYNGTDVNEALTTANYITYGVLYNWAAIIAGDESSNSNPSGVQGICPDGWHLPSNTEWTELFSFLSENGFNYDGTIDNGTSKIGKAMANDNAWASSSNTGAVGNTDFPEYRNKSGFNALPGGMYDGVLFLFAFEGKRGRWWTSTESYNGSHIRFQMISYDAANIFWGNSWRELGASVRCVRDN